VWDECVLTFCLHCVCYRFWSSCFCSTHVVRVVSVVIERWWWWWTVVVMVVDDVMMVSASRVPHPTDPKVRQVDT
jgi:hypothetical protein